MENYINSRRIIWITIILSFLTILLYIFSYNLQKWPILIALFIFERLAAPFTGNCFGDALEQVGELLDLDLRESKALVASIITLLGFIVVMIAVYLYILFTAPLLFILLMIAELIDKGIEKFSLKKA